MRILVTGREGQVGREVSRWVRPGWELCPMGRAECDLSRPEQLRELVRSVAPQVIVNAAAYTAVDQAEKESGLCFAVNAEAPRVLAEEAARLNALFVHYSTDYVFDGEKNGPYLEDDAIHPLNVYGASKAAGEDAVAGAAGRCLILRTSWVYSAAGRNFLRTILRLAAERTELSIVDDQIGSPTAAGAIAAATARLVEEAYLRPHSLVSGIYHMTAAGAISWCGFARAILDGSGMGKRPQLRPIATSGYPTPAKRPKNSVLSNDKFEQTFGFRLSSWQEQLKEVLSTIRAAG